jgi:hypothetical protein
VSGHQPRLDLLGAVDNPQCFRDHGTARQRRPPPPAHGFALTQSLDHRGFQAATRLGIDRGIDGLVADAGSRVIGMHAPQSVRNLLRRPAPMNEMAVYEGMGRTTYHQLAGAPTSRAPNVVNQPRRLRAIGTVILTTPRQFPANRARRPVKKHPDRLLAAAPVMFGVYHATFLAAEVLASSVHRNILCPKGRRCCTCNLSLRCTLRGMRMSVMRNLRRRIVQTC